MQLPATLRVLRRQMLLIVAAMVVGLSIGGFVGLTTPQRYEASAEVLLSVQAAPGASAWEQTQATSYAQQVIESYRAVVTTTLVLQPVIDDLGVDLTVQELASSIDTTVTSKSLVIGITVTQPNPVRTARLANAVAARFAEVVTGELEDRPADAAYSINIVPLQPAVVPTTPAAPNVPLALTFGAVIGLGAGVGVALLRGVIDVRIRTREDLEQATDLPRIGAIADDPAAERHPLIVATEPHNPRAENFRVLRTNVGFFLRPNAPGIFAVTSASPAEGKSTVSANLALSLVEAGKRVVLIDADMRRPRLAERFGIEPAAGLSDVLAHRMSVNDAIRRWRRSGLFLLPAGTVPPNPAELLGSVAMSSLLDDLSRAFDIILIDTPPVLPVTDAAVVSRHVDGTILVAAAGRTTTAQFLEAINRLRAVEARIVGTVLCGDPAASATDAVYGDRALATRELTAL